MRVRTITGVIEVVFNPFHALKIDAGASKALRSSGSEHYKF